MVDRLTQTISYKLVKVTIDAPGLVKVIINIIVYHHGISESIVTD